MSLNAKDGLNTVVNRSVQLKFQTVVHVDMCNLKYVNHTCRLHNNYWLEEIESQVRQGD